jgi:predicted membrane protein (TIGR00267 family)
VTSLGSRLRHLLGKEDVRAISRRYFISNGFDGTVVTGLPNGLMVVKIGLGAAVGLGTSAVWSVWEIGRAETRAEIQRVEQAMLVDLDDTRIQREQSGARLLHSIMSGLSPLIGVLVPLTPFFFEGVYLTMAEAGVIAVAIGVGILGTFGAYMGSISGQRWYVAAARMGIAGLVVAGINFFIPG